MTEAKVAVIGDSRVGKTLLCHRFQSGANWARSTLSSSTQSARQEFFFCEYDPEFALKSHACFARQHPQQEAPQSNDKHSDEWNEILPCQSVTLKIVEPSGVDRSSLQQIIFRRVVGLIIVHDAVALWEEYLATDVPRSCRTGTPTPLPWEAYLDESIQFWTRMAMEGSGFASACPGVKLPVVAVFSKTDLLVASLKDECDDGNVPSDDVTRLGDFRRSDGSFVAVVDFFREVAEHLCGELSSTGPATPTAAEHSPESTPRVTCDGCYFVSSVNERRCRDRTQAVVNDVIELIHQRIVASASQKIPQASVIEPNTTKKKRSETGCCSVM